MDSGHGRGDEEAPDAVRAPARGPARLFVRDPDNGIIGGVCAGVAARTGIDPLLIRLVAALAGLSAGFGLACYVTLWVTTPTPRDDRSPVERVLPGFRRTGWFGFSVLLLAACAGTFLTVRGLVPLAWWPFALVVLVVVAMWVLRPVVAASERRRRIAAARPAPARSTRPVTVITWIALPAAAAAGAGMFLLVDASPLAQVVCAVAAALGTIGIGLVLTSLWGISRLLRDVGVLLGVVILLLDTPFITTLGVQAQSDGADGSGPDWDASGAVVVDGQNMILDLGALPPQDTEMTVQAHDSNIHVIAPDTRAVTIEYSCLFSELTLPSGGGCTSIGSGVWTSGIPSAPPSQAGDAEARPADTLHVKIKLVRSQVEVAR